MLFETSRQAGSIPIVLVLGECLTATRLFINFLIAKQGLSDSVVISVKQDTHDRIRHPRLIELPRLEFSAQDNCLCCGMHGALGDVLRQIFFSALNDRSKRLDRVLIESDSIESSQLAHTLKHTPFLGQRYFHQMTFRVVSPPQPSNAFFQKTDAWQSYLSSLKGLDPMSDQSRQILIISLPQAQFNAEQFNNWSMRVKQELPYKEVFYLSADGASDLNLLQKMLGLGSNDK
jgi:hypothetical protein